MTLEVPASYWLNYESKYREHQARQKELHDLGKEDIKSYAKRFRFEEVFEGLDMTLAEQAVEMLKLLGIGGFENFDDTIKAFESEFVEGGGEKEAIAVWISMCDEEIELQNLDLSQVEYSKAKLLLAIIKTCRPSFLLVQPLY